MTYAQETMEEHGRQQESSCFLKIEKEGKGETEGTTDKRESLAPPQGSRTGPGPW